MILDALTGAYSPHLTVRTHLARSSGKSAGWESGSKIKGKLEGVRGELEKEVTLVDVSSHHLPGVNDSPPSTHTHT